MAFQKINFYRRMQLKVAETKSEIRGKHWETAGEFVAKVFLPAGSGNFPVASFLKPRTGMSALRCGAMRQFMMDIKTKRRLNLKYAKNIKIKIRG